METIDVICVVFPNGETSFMPAEGFKPDDSRKALDAWKARLQPEALAHYEQAQVMGGFLWMHMLKADYDQLPATSLSHAISQAMENGHA